MTADTIACPKCGAAIPLTEAVTHSIREQIAGEFAAKAREREEAFARREQQLAAQQAKLDATLEQRIEAERSKIREDARLKAAAALSLELEDLRTQVSENKRKLEEANAQELALRKRQRELEEKAATAERDTLRKLDEERALIRQKAIQEASDQQLINLQQKDKLIADLKQQIESLNAKAAQSSQQAQGEILECSLEEEIRRAFPSDDVSEVLKGQRGADITQRVRTNTGVECGQILWETKRTQNWSGKWTEKLKEDQRNAKADVAILVTANAPAELRGFGPLDGVWVCDPRHAIPLATALRQGLIAAAHERQAGAGKAGKAEQLYGYLTGVEFRHRIEAIVEAFSDLQNDIDRERRAMERLWNERAKRIEQVLLNTAGLYGSVQGIVGRDSLPEIQTLALENQADLPE